MLRNKESEVLHYLLKQPHGVPLSQIALHFSLSERSIRYYIQNINYEIMDGITIQKRMCYLQHPEQIARYVSTCSTIPYTSEIKRQLLLYHLLFEGHINLSAFSRKLDISRSSTKHYIEDIRKELMNHHMELHQEHKIGLLLHAAEDDIRQMQLSYLLAYHTMSLTNQKILAPVITKFQEGIHVVDITRFLQKIQETLSFVLSDISYDMMYNYCIIILQRIHDGHRITSCDNEYFLLTCPEYHAIATYFDTMVHDDVDIHYEILHLTSLLIGSHYAKSSDMKGNNWFEHDLLVTKIISLYSRYYGVNLNHDRTLYESLLHHLRPTMYRMLHHIPFAEVNYQEVKTSFPREYETMHQVLRELNFFTNEAQDRNEIALLTLHLKAALQRCAHQDITKLRVLIVCSHGYGTSHLLEQQLLDTYEIDVVDCIPFHQLNDHGQLADVDVIVTTIDTLNLPLPQPILHVHPILTTEDIRKLNASLPLKQQQQIRMSLLLDAIKQSCTIHELQNLKNDLHTVLKGSYLCDDIQSKTLADIMPLHNIFLNYEATCWQDAIQLAGDLLVEHGYVNDAYQKQMQYSFENYGSYMLIDDGIAIPHAKNEGNVFQTGMTLVTLKEPVTFTNGLPLRVFFSFCSKDNVEHLDALVAIANLIRETDFKTALHQFRTAQEVLQYLTSYTRQEL